LRDSVSEHAILKDARGWLRPSDHVPVIATINF
jgi:exonuclease III